MDEIRIGSTQSVSPPERCPSWKYDTIEPQPVIIRLREEAFRVIHAEASGTLDEVGGLLVGEAVLWEGTLYVDVEAALPGERTRAGPAHITFTADTWSALLERKEREYPAQWVVGWYHSHPRMGIFLSELDVSLHRHFFPEAWHVALVVDAQQRSMGFFSRAGDEVHRVPRFVWAPAEQVSSTVPDLEAIPGSQEPVRDEERPVQRRRRASAWTWLTTFAITAIALALWRPPKRKRNRDGE